MGDAMNPGLLASLDHYSRNTLPVAVTVAFILLGSLPYGAPYIGPVFPALTLMSIYYWSIYRPELIPAWAVFLIGIFQDVLQDTPLGLTALVLLLVHGFVMTQRRVFLGKSFLVVWWGFALVAVGANLVNWLIASFWNSTFLDFAPVFVQLLLSMALYPCLSWMFVKIQRSALG